MRDKLSRLSYRQACLLIGDEKSGSRLLIQVAESCGWLLSAAFELCGNLLPEKTLSQTQQACAKEMKFQLQDCLAPAGDGGVILTVKLPDSAALTSA